MAQSESNSVLRPLGRAKYSTNAQPGLKKRKLSGDTSMVTSLSTSNSPSSAKKSNSRKRSLSEMDVDVEENESSKNIISAYSINKMLKSDKTLKGQISADATQMIANATQYFLEDLLRKCISENEELDYDQIAEFIDSRDNLAFLSDIVPKRITFGQAMKIQNKVQKERKKQADEIKQMMENAKNTVTDASLKEYEAKGKKSNDKDEMEVEECVDE